MYKRVTGELTPANEVVQVFRAAGGSLSVISVVTATYARLNRGSLTFSLHRMPRGYVPPASLPEVAEANPPAYRHRLFAKLRGAGLLPARRAPLGAQLASVTVSCNALFDGDMFNFPLDPVMTQRGELFALRILATGTARGSAPTLWVTESAERISGHAVCYIEGKPQNDFGLIGSITYGGQIANTRVPQMLLYSPVTQCNLNCIHCISAHTRTRVSRLPDSTKDQIRAWAKSGELEVISSDYSGDLLWADHRFGGELDYLFSLEVPFHIDTNGVCLTRETSMLLCQHNMASLNISLDAAMEETYKRIRKGSLPLHEVVANIEEFMRIRASMKPDLPVSISFTIMRSTLAEWADFVRLGARLGVNIVISRHLEAFTAEMEKDSLWHDQAAFNATRLEIVALANELGVKVTIPPPYSGIPRTGRRICDVPWTSAVVLGNGDVAACCVPGLVMGNLNTASMEEIWNGKTYRELRATVNSDTPNPVCAACPMFRLTDNPDSYLVHSAMRRLNA